MSAAVANPRLAGLRRWAAAAIGFVALIPFIMEYPSEPAVVVPMAMPFVAAGAIHVRSLGAQLSARAAWWSNLALGAILCLTGGNADGRYGVFMALGAGAALLIAGRAGVAEATQKTGFAPAAHKNTLLALMVLALADASTFLLIGLIEEHGARMLLVSAGAVLCLGFVGLYRLELWGVLINVVASVVVAGLVGLRLVHTDKDVIAPIVVLGVLQLLVATPMLVSLALRRSTRPIPQRVSALLAAAAVIVLMIVSAASRLTR